MGYGIFFMLNQEMTEFLGAVSFGDDWEPMVPHHFMDKKWHTWHSKTITSYPFLFFPLLSSSFLFLFFSPLILSSSSPPSSSPLTSWSHISQLSCYLVSFVSSLSGLFNQDGDRGATLLLCENGGQNDH